MYTYRLMPSAIQDLRDIADYIASDLCAPESAAGPLNEIETAVENACAFPLSLPSVRDELLQMKGYRKIIVRNYIVFALLDEKKKTLNVMRVLYHARDYLKEL